ncbi:MAG TPA: cell division protein FtsQ, partial [Brevundimonas sp.]|nr:cell division protein FtsQ [Brevundimonas sp.]
MPAVVRGGRRQSSAKGGARGAPSGRAAEIGRLDTAPRGEAATLGDAVGVLLFEQ